MSRGVDGCAIVRDDADRRMFLAHVRVCVERYDWVVQALCLMTTHYHLVSIPRASGSLGESSD